MGRLLIQLPGTTTAKALTETLSKNVIIVDEDLHQLRLHDGTTAGGHLIGGSSGSGVPVGTIIPFAGNSIPQGYLLCDGSAISRTTYASLFAVIGTIYGAGNGNSTFNLPYKQRLRAIDKGEVVSIIDGSGIYGSVNKVLWYHADGQPMTSSQSSKQYFAAAFGNNTYLDSDGHGGLGSASQLLHHNLILDNNSGSFFLCCIKY